MTQLVDTGAVIIGRNEGARLIACLESAKLAVKHIVYVDSGSTDGSLEAAQSVGAHVVALDLSKPFTAARARNTGLAALLDVAPVEFVQFIDGDCALDPDWVPTAHAFLVSHSDVAVVCGRRREMHPEASIFNRMCDAEWDTPIGEARACGGDALMRVAAINEVKGYNPTLIAGEEPEMCVRLRAKGHRIWRLDQEMTLHDAAMTRLGQWWQRARRAGFTYAEGAVMHGKSPERHGVTQLSRTLIWGVAIPVLVLLLALFVSGWWLLVLGLYPLQIARIARRHDPVDRQAVQTATFLTLGKFAEAQGVLDYAWNKLLRRQRSLIEYK